MSTFDQDNRPLILEAGRADLQYWIDLWRYQELFIILVWREVAARDKQTVIGIAWSCVRPFMSVLVFAVTLASLAGLTLCGVVPGWQILLLLVFAALAMRLAGPLKHTGLLAGQKPAPG